VKQAGTKRTDAPYCSGAVEDMAQVEELGERCGASGAWGGVALNLTCRQWSARPSCSVHQTLNRRTASTATLRTVVAIWENAAGTEEWPAQFAWHPL